MRIPLVLALVCGLVAPGVVAQTAKRPMTFKDLMAMRRVSDPQVSVSGKWVMFSVTDVSLEKNSKVNHLWVVPMDGSAPARQVTSNTGESFGRFVPNEQFVSYTGAPTKDDPVSRITIATWDEKTGTIGMGRTLRAVSGDADGAIWSPDSKHILFTTEVYPECSVKGGDAALKGVEPLDGSAVLGGSLSVAAWKTLEPATWAEEDACDKAKDEAADASPVKAQLFGGLLYRHWDHYTGQKRTHIVEADFSMDGANPRDLTPANVVGDAETPTFSLGGPLGYAISPDGREIAYEVNLEKVPAESTNNDIFVLQVGAEPGTARKVSTSLGSDDGPAYSPDGRWLAWRSQKRDGYESDKFDLVVMDRATGKVRDLTPGFDGWVDEFTWSVDSAKLFFTSPSGGEELIFRADINDMKIDRIDAVVPVGQAEDVAISAGFRNEFSSLVPSADGKFLIASRSTVDHPNDLYVLNIEELNGPITPSPKELARMLGDLHGVVAKPDNAFQVFYHPITHLNEALVDSLDLSPLEPFWFTGANGTKVEGFLVKPPDFDASKKYPVKFLIHGGPQGDWGDAWSYRWNPELFAADGYVVVMVNPRGSTGYGQRFLEEVSGDWGGRPFVDLMKGMDAAEAKFPFIDKNRECALGASYGGFMADWVLTHTDRFKCIVTHDGMYDPVSAFGATEELWFNEWEFRPLAGTAKRARAGAKADPPPAAKDDNSSTAKDDNSSTAKDDNSSAAKDDNSTDAGDAVVEQSKPARPWDFYNRAGEFVGKPSVDDPFVRWSPMMFIKNAKTPTLVVHSQRDYRLDVSQGLQLFTALQLLGVPSEMLYYPDEGHWVLKPQNSELWYRTVDDWCDRWVGMGKYATVGAEKNPMEVRAK